MLNKQYCIFSTDTSAFYFENERLVEQRLNNLRRQKKAYKKVLLTCIKGDYLYELIEAKISKLTKSITACKECLLDMLNINIKKTRELNPLKLRDQNRISIFDSALTRAFSLIPENHDIKQTADNTHVNLELMSVTTYYFQVLESLICNGYNFDGKHYVYLSSSAGAIRTKRGLFAQEEILNANWNKLTAGLTFDKINAKGSITINKLNAYLALCSSATDVWPNFDIDRAIVVDDFETNVVAEVDYVDDKDYSITRQTQPCAIPHTDGSGIILPELTDKNFMFRLPWFKGLLCVMDFKRFCEEKGATGKIKDIWGKEWDIFADNIQIIFTKSQFKMYKFFDSWQEYKDNFRKYGCEAGKGKEDDTHFKKARINYQMLSSFIDYSDDELRQLCKTQVDFINGISTKKENQLELFGIRDGKPMNKYNGFQKCLCEYPSLLKDAYCREQIKSLQKKMVKELYAGKFKVNGYYTFIIPDMYAFCEWLFLGIEVPNGLLKTKQVHCKLHKWGEVDCLRSPHLYFEHSIQNNTTNDEIEKWFTTNGLYTSTYDMITRELQNDTDGDQSLVIQDKLLIEMAKRNQTGIVTLFYNMHKALPEPVTPKSRYKGLSTAFTGGNIGVISNNIAKIKNSPEITNPSTRDEAIKVIKWSCMINNEVIDFAKALYKSTPPDDVNKLIRKYVNRKLPHFFIYAKDKLPEQCEEISNAIVDRIFTLYPQEQFKIKFSDSKRFDYKMLMHNPNIKVDESVLRTYSDTVSNIKLKTGKNDERSLNSTLVSDIIAVMSNLSYKQIDVCDMLIKDMFKDHTVFKDNRCKDFFFLIYGDMVYENISKNKERFVICPDCGREFERITIQQCRCKKCQSKSRRLYKTAKQSEYRQKT